MLPCKAYRLIAATSTLLSLTASASEQAIDLGYKLTSGTYTVAVHLPRVGERSLTLDTGASYTVLDREDVLQMPDVVTHSANVRLHMPYNGRTVQAFLVTIPGMRVGNCMLYDRDVVVADLPGERQGALGMNDLEALAPFTFVGNGAFEFECPHTKR